MGAAIAFPMLLVAFALTTTLRVAYGVLFATGVAMIIFNALSNGVLQLLVDERFRGRLMAFYSLVFVGLSQAVGAGPGIAMSAVVLLGASLIALRWSDFWRIV